MLSEAVLALAIAASVESAADSPARERAPLVVATRNVPPLSYRDTDGRWHGASIDLWERVAAELGVAYELREASIDDMIAGLRDGRYDVVAAAVTVTAEREAVVDFTHPFYSAGLAISMDVAETPTWLVIARSLLSLAFAKVVLAIALLQVIAGTLVWLVERRHNPRQFPQRPLAGVGSGFWWAVVTMTTVGYGDKAPATALGRAIALGWMLASVVMISVFTASVASSMTLQRLDSSVRGPEDLTRLRVGVVAATTSEHFGKARGLDYRRFASLDDGLDAVARDEIDAFVYDAPMLEHAIARDWTGVLHVLPARFQRQDYAFALPDGSSLREPINRVLPDLVREADVYVEPAVR